MRASFLRPHLHISMGKEDDIRDELIPRIGDLRSKRKLDMLKPNELAKGVYKDKYIRTMVHDLLGGKFTRLVGICRKHFLPVEPTKPIVSKTEATVTYVPAPQATGPMVGAVITLMYVLVWATWRPRGLYCGFSGPYERVHRVRDAASCPGPVSHYGGTCTAPRVSFERARATLHVPVPKEPRVPKVTDW